MLPLTWPCLSIYRNRNRNQDTGDLAGAADGHLLRSASCGSARQPMGSGHPSCWALMLQARSVPWEPGQGWDLWGQGRPQRSCPEVPGRLGLGGDWEATRVKAWKGVCGEFQAGLGMDGRRLALPGLTLGWPDGGGLQMPVGPAGVGRSGAPPHPSSRCPRWCSGDPEGTATWSARRLFSWGE